MSPLTYLDVTEEKSLAYGGKKEENESPLTYLDVTEEKSLVYRGKKRKKTRVH